MNGVRRVGVSTADLDLSNRTMRKEAHPAWRAVRCGTPEDLAEHQPRHGRLVAEFIDQTKSSMQLLLSSATVPDASVTALCEAAEDRGMEGLELVVNPTTEEGLDPGCEGHGCRTDGPTLDGGALSIPWVLREGTASVAEVLYGSRQASLLDAGLLLRDVVPESPLGCPVALMHGTDRQAAQRVTAWARMHDATTCWEVQLDAVDELDVEEVLDVTGATLAHVRLLGAGPETETRSSRRPGTGALFKELTLRGYSGTVALAASAAGSGDAWRRWLFDERGWGCNTAAKKNAKRAVRSS